MSLIRCRGGRWARRPRRSRTSRDRDDRNTPVCISGRGGRHDCDRQVRCDRRHHVDCVSGRVTSDEEEHEDVVDVLGSDVGTNARTPHARGRRLWLIQGRGRIPSKDPNALCGGGAIVAYPQERRVLTGGAGEHEGGGTFDRPAEEETVCQLHLKKKRRHRCP